MTTCRAVHRNPTTPNHDGLRCTRGPTHNGQHEAATASGALVTWLDDAKTVDNPLSLQAQIDATNKRITDLIAALPKGLLP